MFADDSHGGWRGRNSSSRQYVLGKVCNSRLVQSALPTTCKVSAQQAKTVSSKQAETLDLASISLRPRGQGPTVPCQKLVDNLTTVCSAKKNAHEVVDCMAKGKDAGEEKLEIACQQE